MFTPTFEDVVAAREFIAPYLPKTPLIRVDAISEMLDCEYYAKLDNLQPVGSFKVRGGVNIVGTASDEERRRSMVAASTGNHGQSVSYAARLFGVKARIVVPEASNPGKVAAMRGMGAEVILQGERFDQARLYCEQLAREHRYRYIHSGDEPLLIAGVATEALEMLEDEPELDLIFVPVGGGSGAAGVCIVADAVSSTVRVVGVQSESSPAAYQSWKAKRLIEAPNETFAEGLATGTAFALPQAILWERLKEFVLVPDDEIMRAMVWMIERAHTLAEADWMRATIGELPVVLLDDVLSELDPQRRGYVLQRVAEPDPTHRRQVWITTTETSDLSSSQTHEFLNGAQCFLIDAGRLRPA